MFHHFLQHDEHPMGLKQSCVDNFFYQLNKLSFMWKQMTQIIIRYLQNIWIGEHSALRIFIQYLKACFVKILLTFTKPAPPPSPTLTPRSTVMLVWNVLFSVFSSSIRCKNGMNHLRDRVPHMAEGLCQYAHQYNNKVLICKVRLTADTRSLGEQGSSSVLVGSAFVLVVSRCVLFHFPLNCTFHAALKSCPICFSAFHVFSGATKEAERWLWCPRHQLPLITHGLDWPNMPGQGAYLHTDSHICTFSYS